MQALILYLKLQWRHPMPLTNQIIFERLQFHSIRLYKNQVIKWQSVPVDIWPLMWSYWQDSTLLWQKMSTDTQNETPRVWPIYSIAFARKEVYLIFFICRLKPKVTLYHQGQFDLCSVSYLCSYHWLPPNGDDDATPVAGKLHADSA